jgi:hypothetical protein
VDWLQPLVDWLQPLVDWPTGLFITGVLMTMS